MNNVKKSLLALCLVSVAAGAFAAQQHHTKDDGKGAQEQRMHPMMPHPMMMPPVYQSSMQTDDPASALKKLTSDVPALEKGKRYNVRVEVTEMLPPPPAPMAPGDQKTPAAPAAQ